jgi:hypothetical protein
MTPLGAFHKVVKLKTGLMRSEGVGENKQKQWGSGISSTVKNRQFQCFNSQQSKNQKIKIRQH